MDGADGGAEEVDDFEFDGGAHAADLAMFAFVEGDLEDMAFGGFVGFEDVDIGWFGETVFELDAEFKFVNFPVVEVAIDYDLVGLGDVVLGMGEFVGEVAVVGE